MAEMVKLAFEKDDFDRFIFLLEACEEQRIIEIIKRFGYTGQDKDGTEWIGVELFSSDAPRLIYSMMDVVTALTVKPKEQYFEQYYSLIKERNRLYQEEKERKNKELQAGIRKILEENPSASGTEIARRLHISKNVVYAHWHDVKKEMGI